MILNILYSFNVFILEVRVECFIKGKWGFAFDCRSLQIRWFLSGYTQCGCQETVSLLSVTSLDDRWHLLDGKWGNRILEDKKNKNKKVFALATLLVHDFF